MPIISLIYRRKAKTGDKFTRRISTIPGRTDWSAEQWGSALHSATFTACRLEILEGHVRRPALKPELLYMTHVTLKQTDRPIEILLRQLIHPATTNSIHTQLAHELLSPHELMVARVLLRGLFLGLLLLSRGRYDG
jgi:hypothetical protein